MLCVAQPASLITARGASVALVLFGDHMNALRKSAVRKNAQYCRHPVRSCLMLTTRSALLLDHDLLSAQRWALF